MSSRSLLGASCILQLATVLFIFQPSAFSSNPCPLKPETRHLSSALRPPSSDLRPPSSDLRHLSSALCPLPACPTCPERSRRERSRRERSRRAEKCKIKIYPATSACRVVASCEAWRLCGDTSIVKGIGTQFWQSL